MCKKLDREFHILDSNNSLANLFKSSKIELIVWLRSSAWSEHWTFNPGVEGSNPFGAISTFDCLWGEYISKLALN